MTIKIDKNIPIPPMERSRGRPLGSKTSPVYDMAIGESFFSKHGSAASRYIKVTGFKFTRRKVEGGYRFWRVA